MADDDDEVEEEEEEGDNLGTYVGERNEKQERHGHGKAVLANGDIYEGQYENGKRNGIGTYKFKKSKARYIGNYIHNRKQGNGTMIYPDGTKYEGNWCDDQRNGFGKYYYLNGDTYDGEWRRNKRNGLGVYVHAAVGSSYLGWWKKGKREGHAELIHLNHKYIGPFKKDLPFGVGKYEFSINCQQNGEYIHRLPEGEEEEEEEEPETDEEGEEEEEEEEVVEKKTKKIPIWKAETIRDLYPEPGLTMQQQIAKRMEEVKSEMLELDRLRRLGIYGDEEEEEDEEGLPIDDLLLDFTLPTPDQSREPSLMEEPEDDEEDEEEEEGSCEESGSQTVITDDQAKILKAASASKEPTAT